MSRTANYRLQNKGKNKLNNKVTKHSDRPRVMPIFDDFDDLLDIPAGAINRIKMQARSEVQLCR